MVLCFFLPPCGVAQEGVNSCICHILHMEGNRRTCAMYACAVFCVVYTTEHVFLPVFCMRSVFLLVITVYLRLEYWRVRDCSTQEATLFPRLAAGLHNSTDVSKNVGSGWSVIRPILD